MINSTVTFFVSGDNYEDIVTKTRVYLSEFLDVPIDYVDKKINIEIQIQEHPESLDFSDETYQAQVIAQVKNV